MGFSSRLLSPPCHAPEVRIPGLRGAYLLGHEVKLPLALSEAIMRDGLNYKWLNREQVAAIWGDNDAACDCPACTPLCQRTGRKCFVPCVECISTVEYDAVGPITSQTVRMVNPEHVLEFRISAADVASIYSNDFWEKALSDKPSSEMPGYHIDRCHDDFWRQMAKKMIDAGILKPGEA